MIIIVQRDEAERLQHSVCRLPRRLEDLGHAVDRARMRLKRYLDERAVSQRMCHLQQPAGDRDGLEFSFSVPAIFQANRSQDRIAQLDPGRAPRRVRLGEVGHKLAALWHRPMFRHRLPKPLVQIPPR